VLLADMLGRWCPGDGRGCGGERVLRCVLAVVVFVPRLPNVFGGVILSSGSVHPSTRRVGTEFLSCVQMQKRRATATRERRVQVREREGKSGSAGL
jgi:hypothetical protein